MKLRVMQLLLVLFATCAFAPLASATSLLYVGTQPGCNLGIVGTDPNLLGCTTAPYGSTGPQRYSRTPLWSGLTPGVNAGLVSTQPDFLGGATRFIEYALLMGDVTKPLYVGTTEGCNRGIRHQQSQLPRLRDSLHWLRESVSSSFAVTKTPLNSLRWS